LNKTKRTEFINMEIVYACIQSCCVTTNHQTV